MRIYGTPFVGVPFFMSKIVSEILSQKDAAFRSLKDKRETWDNVERLFHGQLNDALSSDTKSKVFDPRLATLLIERSHRVMAQLPAGKIKGISKNDLGDAKLKNLLLEKYVIPNANSQFDFLTKLRMVDLYSNIYGNFFALFDWVVKPNGYVGPDMWLLNIRDVFPQIGAVSLEDSDQIIIRTWRPLPFFKNLKKTDGFKNLDKIITTLDKKSGSKTNRDSENISKREEENYTREPGPDGYFEVLTRYERDRWVDICVDADEVFRDIENPHDNGELPVVCKYSLPLLDDFMGLADAERGAPMQMVVNSVWNLYLDAVKMSIFPPVLINKDNIASMSSLKWGAAAKWLVRNQIGNSVSTIPLSPQGISTFNNTFGAANASILNLFGTSDTTVTTELDAGFGKTPQALKMQQNRENTRDNADRFYMERFVEAGMTRMVNLLSKKQSTAITLRMLDSEVKEISKDYPDIVNLFDSKTGKLKIEKSRGSTLYDYEIISGSTYALDQEAQQKNLAMLLEMYRSSQTPNGNMLVENLKNEGYRLNFGELFKRVVSSSGIQDWDKILEEIPEEERAQQTLDQDRVMFEQMLQQMQNSVNAIPTQPEVQQVSPEQAGGQLPTQI